MLGDDIISRKSEQPEYDTQFLLIFNTCWIGVAGGGRESELERKQSGFNFWLNTW